MRLISGFFVSDFQKKSIKKHVFMTGISLASLPEKESSMMKRCEI